MVAGHKPKDRIWERDYITILKLLKITQKLPSHKVCNGNDFDWPVSILAFMYYFIYIHTYLAQKFKKYSHFLQCF